jgi:hypothetical protein
MDVGGHVVSNSSGLREASATAAVNPIPISQTSYIVVGGAFRIEPPSDYQFPM